MTSHASQRPSARSEPAGGYAVAVLAGSGLIVAVLMALAAWLGRSPSPVTWYLARAAGIVLYLLLWTAVVTGLGLTTGLLDRWPGRGILFSLHAFATNLTYGFLALHVISLAADTTVRFVPRDLLVPFASGWREPWTGFGVLAAGLTVLIGASFSLKRIIGQRAWRALHWLTFPLYALALLHGVGAGSDTSAPWMSALYLTTASTVVLLASYRLLRGGARAPAPTGGVERARRAAVSA
jgi:sulfoxide reductase heme-binding subunit YedZ